MRARHRKWSRCCGRLRGLPTVLPSHCCLGRLRRWRTPWVLAWQNSAARQRRRRCCEPVGPASGFIPKRHYGNGLYGAFRPCACAVTFCPGVLWTRLRRMAENPGTDRKYLGDYLRVGKPYGGSSTFRKRSVLIHPSALSHAPQSRPSPFEAVLSALAKASSRFLGPQFAHWACWFARRQ